MNDAIVFPLLIYYFINPRLITFTANIRRPALCPLTKNFHFTYNNRTEGHGFCRSPISYVYRCAADLGFNSKPNCCTNNTSNISSSANVGHVVSVKDMDKASKLHFTFKSCRQSSRTYDLG